MGTSMSRFLHFSSFSRTLYQWAKVNGLPFTIFPFFDFLPLPLNKFWATVSYKHKEENKLGTNIFENA
jgi:hypothetical protein